MKISALDEFGGEPKVRATLARAIRDARSSRGMTNDQLDEMCGFDGSGFPKSSDFELNPSKLSGRAFGLACLALEINMDDVLHVKLDNAKTEQIVAQMDEEAVHVTAACGGGDVGRIDLKDQVQVYMLLKAVEGLG